MLFSVFDNIAFVDLAMVVCTIFFPTYRLLSHMKIVKTMDSVDRRMNPVAMTIIYPRKEMGRDGDRTSDSPNTQVLYGTAWAAEGRL